MKISLILATKNRVEEVRRFVESLAVQAHRDLELVVVDQNDDDRLESVLEDAAPVCPPIRLRCEAGLSRARNAGLEVVTGDIIGFPDDDCWYPEGLLSRVVHEFESQPGLHGLTGRSEDGEGHPSGGSFSRSRGGVNFNNVWKRGISYTIFLRSSVCEAVGTFDEELGVGARTRFGSGEETDYLIRAVKMGFRIQYLPDLVVYHPNPVLYTRSHRDKAFRYGLGMGRVLSKHDYKLSFNFFAIFRPVAGALLSLLTLRPQKAAYHLAIAGGRLCGLWSS